MDWNPVIPFDQTFDALYGLQVDEVTEERVAAHVEVRDAVKQPMGLVHGGLLASIAEAITSIATAGAVGGEGKVATGMSHHMSFLRPITGGTVHAVAHRRHRGRTTWLWDVEITDDQGRLCAMARMTIAVRDLPAGTR